MLKKKIKRNHLIKSLSFFLLLIAIFEGTIAILEKDGNMFEPYNWDSRMEISIEVNEAKTLFLRDENQKKIKIVTMGDSRIERSFNPYLNDDLLENKTISYNLGIHGTSMDLQTTYLENIIIPKIKPDIVIWDTYFKDFCQYDSISLEGYSPMLDYYTQNTSGLSNYDRVEYYANKYSRVYRYKSLFEYENMKDQYQMVYQNKFQNNRGFKSKPKVTDSGFINKTIGDWTNSISSPDLVSRFFHIIDLFEEKNIEYLIINTPQNNFNYKNWTIFEEEIASNLPKSRYINFDSPAYEVFNHYEYYYDKNHLNSFGAEVFTEILSQKLSDQFIKNWSKDFEKYLTLKQIQVIIPAIPIGYSIFVLLIIKSPLKKKEKKIC